MAGKGPVYATYLGGTAEDVGLEIAVDKVNGNAYVTGFTDSATFTGVARPASRGGVSDGFAVRLDATGRRVYATYLSGSHGDRGTGIAVDGSGNAYGQAQNY